MLTSRAVIDFFFITVKLNQLSYNSVSPLFNLIFKSKIFSLPPSLSIKDLHSIYFHYPTSYKNSLVLENIATLNFSTIIDSLTAVQINDEIKRDLHIIFTLQNVLKFLRTLNSAA